MVDGYSSAERRANVRKQLRDRKGRWIEMGAKVRFMLNGRYETGTVTGIHEDDEEISVESPDGTTRRIRPKALESIGAKASLSRDEDKNKRNDDEESNRRDESKDTEEDDLDARILDLELEEDVLREEGGDKDRLREVQRERRELQKERSERDKEAGDSSRDSDRESSSSSSSSDKDRDRDADTGGPGAPGTPENGDDESSASKPSAPSDGNDESSKSKTPDTPDHGDDESSTSKPSSKSPDLPNHGDDESSTSKPRPSSPNLPERGDDETGLGRESIDILDVDRLVDGDRVFLEDTANGPEDVTEFLREDGAWIGSNDFEDLELDSEALKDYIEARDPKDLTVARSAPVVPGRDGEGDIPRVGSRVSFTIGGADGTGRVVSVDESTGTAEISVNEGTVEVSLDDLSTEVSDSDTADGPSTSYVPRAVPLSKQMSGTEQGTEGQLSVEERFFYDEARARLSVLLGRSAGAIDEVTDLENVIKPLHERATAEFAESLSPAADAAPTEEFPEAGTELATAPLNGAENLEEEAAALYGTTDAQVSSTNAELRAGYADADALALQDLILQSEITDNTSLFRGEYVSLETAEQITPGRTLRNESFMSTMKSADDVDSYLERFTDPAKASGKIPVQFRIEADAGAPGVDISGQPGHDQEVLLPAGVELEVTSVGWDADTEALSVVASYDGTSVASVADLTALEDNPLDTPDTTVDELEKALEKTNNEVNKHQFAKAVAVRRGEPAAEDATRKLAKATAIRDSISALLKLQNTADTENAEGSSLKVTNPSKAAELAKTVTGTDLSSQLIREALRAPETENGSVFVVQDENGDITGAVATAEHTFTSESDETVDYIKIGDIGAHDGADGAQLLNAALEDAHSRGQGVMVDAPSKTAADQLEGQGFVADPFKMGMKGYGLTPEALEERIQQGHPTDQEITAHPGDLEPLQDSSEPDAAPKPGSVVDSVERLDALPEGSWVGISTPDGPTKLYQQDDSGNWVSSVATEDEAARTSQELVDEAAANETTMWVEGEAAEAPDIQSDTPNTEAPDADGVPVAEGDTVSDADGNSWTVSEVEDDGEHVQAIADDGTQQRLRTDTVIKADSQEDQRQKDSEGRFFISDGSGLALYEGSEAATEQGNGMFGSIVSIDKDGDHVEFRSEDGTTHRISADDLDLAMSVEVEIEE